MKLHKNALDLRGEKFGRLTAIRPVGRDKAGSILWECECECGGMVVVLVGDLRRGHTQSCGCLQRERVSTLNGLYVKHPREYVVWRNMIRRTSDPYCPSFEDYGLEGLKCCGRWKGTNGFKNFIEDMGPRPGDGYELDREWNDGPYASWNCRWVTKRENSLNRHTTRWITFRGHTLCLEDWARAADISQSTLSHRLNRHGWSIEKALTTPVKSRSKQTGATSNVH